MNNQDERSRMDEDNISDKETDVTRSQRRQSAGVAGEGRNTAATEGQQGDDTQQKAMDQTGGHQEGNYEKTGN